jgi:hypothetical protein
LLAAWGAENKRTRRRFIKNEKNEVEMKSSLQFFCLSLFLNIHTRARIKVHTYQEEEEEEVEEL